MATVLEAPEEHSKLETAAPKRASKPHKRHSLLLKISLLVVSLAIAVLAVEVGLRLTVPITGIPYYFWDPVVGPRRQPNTAGHYVSGNHINTNYRFNAQGWNFPEDYTVAKPANTRRVCIVGDSFVEALQVNPNESLSFIAAQRMSRPERPVQWYPFAISGWGTTQLLEVIRHYVLDYHPDVVAMLFVENDPFDSSPYLGPIEPYVATYALDSNDELELRAPQYWERSALKRLAVQSAAVRYLTLQKGWMPRLPQSEVEDLGIQRRAGAFASVGHDVPEFESLTMEERQQRTWLLIEKTLEACRDLCREHGAEFVLAYRGHLPEIEAALGGEAPEKLPVEDDPYCLGSRLFEMGREQLEPIARRLGIPYLDLTDTLVALVEETGQSHVFPVDTHYNAAAHRAVGEALAKWIDPMLDAPEQENRETP